MIKSILKIILKVIGAIIIVGILIWALSCTNMGAVSDFAKDVRRSVVEFFNPAAVVESQIQRIAEELGWNEDDAEAFVKKFGIEGLEVIDLPEGAVEKKTVEKDFMDTHVTFTLYRDPGYITIAFKDRVITVSIPEKAQKIVAMWAL